MPINAPPGWRYKIARDDGVAAAEDVADGVHKIDGFIRLGELNWDWLHAVVVFHSCGLQCLAPSDVGRCPYGGNLASIF